MLPTALKRPLLYPTWAEKQPYPPSFCPPMPPSHWPYPDQQGWHRSLHWQYRPPCNSNVLCGIFATVHVPILLEGAGLGLGCKTNSGPNLIQLSSADAAVHELHLAVGAVTEVSLRVRLLPSLRPTLQLHWHGKGWGP